uniref:Transposase, MuDR, MULE transposase domain protein n=1 Tax=Tanacetum cinerariifolium TaxID=118510 RepID=A0A6L2P3Z2_TANCI|nr:hypothetical protein [Tanacetum cinerariifolium]
MIYVFLGPLKACYRVGRWEILGLDGAFIKGSYTGQILTDVGVDNNNGVYPIVAVECKSSWLWFLSNLGDDLNLQPNSKNTFISDKQKVIDRCDDPLTSTATVIFRAIKQEANDYSVIWKGGDTYKCNGPWNDQCVMNMTS